jgi:hypothetical protein
MKTNQIMIRENCIEQRTSDFYFNATLTIKFWNEKNPKEERNISEYQRLKSTKDFIDYLQKNEQIEKVYFSSNKGTWMHPLLYVDFCMWVSIEFKAMALKFVLDGLINTRHSAGDYYNEMCATIMERYVEYNGCKPPAMVYINEANMIKEIAGVDIPRNEMTEKQLSKITILQKVNSTLIKEKVGKESRKKQLELISRSL